MKNLVEDRRSRTRMLFAISFGLLVVFGNVQRALAQMTGPDSNNNIYYNAGNVGIGTASPTALLHVNGNAVLAGATTMGSGVSIGGPATTSAPLNVQASPGSLGINIIGRSDHYGYLQFFKNDGTTLTGAIYGITGRLTFTDSASTDVLTIKSGNVGIGTTTPAQKLEVVGGGMRIANPFESANFLYFGPNTDSNWFVGQRYADSSYYYDFGALLGGSAYAQNARGFRFIDTQNNNVNFFIGTGGSVGIGTTSPADDLQVGGTGNHGIQIGSGYAIAIKDVFVGGIGARTDFGEYANTSTFIPRMSILGGNVGIGTTSPSQTLDVRGNAQFYAPNVNNIVKDTGTGYADVAILSQNGSGGILDTGVEGSTASSLLSGTSANDGVLATRNNHNLHLGTNGVSRLIIDTSGNVGIGTTPASGSTYKLDVNGNTNVSGNITASGTINAKYQDVAEWVPSSENLPTGTVVVLDSGKSNQVISSSVSYDTRVAGVVSEQPGIALGEKSDGKVLVATTGRVRVKVDASKGPIHIGDLLVTSDIPGVAMKSEPVNIGGVQFHRPGTLIGKALEPLEKGKGEILVLLSLQ